MIYFVPILIVSLSVERVQITVRDDEPSAPRGYVTEALCKARLAELLALAQASGKPFVVRRAECSRRGG